MCWCAVKKLLTHTHPCSASTVRYWKRSSITLNKNSARVFQRAIHKGSTPTQTSSKWGSKCLVFWTTSTIKDKKSAAKFHYIKAVSGKVVANSIAFRVVSIYWQGTTLPPEILPPSDLPSPVNGILWEMSELITQERIAVGFSTFVEGLTTWPAMYDHWPKSKGQRSRSQGHVTYQQQ